MTFKIKTNLTDVMSYVYLLVFFAIEAFPIYWLFSGAFKPYDQIVNPKYVIPTKFTLEYFIGSDPHISILANPSFFVQFRNTLILSFGTSLITMSISSLAGYAFSRYKFPFSRTIAWIILFAYLFPATYLILPMTFWLAQFNLIDNLLGAILAQSLFTIPFSTYILAGYFASLPREVEESALVDGCGPIGMLLRIVIPLSAPGFVAVFMYSFLMAWNSYLIPLCLLNDRNLWTLPMGIAGMIVGDVIPWGSLFAMSAVYSIPSIILFFILNKYMVAGLTKGAVKY